MSKPLEGIRVVEFSHVISGPICGMLLGDLGADVIKVERPGTGEFYREEAIKNENGISLVYPNYNRNKKGMTLNIKDPKAREIFSKLIKESDVFIENFRPGLLKKMGLGYEELQKINPRLIMVSISGFGQTGPYAAKTAYDMTISAISGFMSVNGPSGEPMKAGPAVSDFLSGIYGALGTVAAIRNRERTGEGQYIDVAMMDSAMSVLDAFFAQYKFTGVEPKGLGNRRANYAPVTVFEAKGGYIYISASLQKHWHALAKLMGREDLTSNSLYAETKVRKQNEVHLEKIILGWTKTKTVEEIKKLLDESAIPCAPVQGIKQVIEDPHVKARQSIVEFDYPGLGAYPTVAFPVKFSNIEIDVRRAPLLGEHNQDILCGLLGYTQAEYMEFLEQNII